MVLRGRNLGAEPIHTSMASDQPVKKKIRIDGPDIDGGSDRSSEGAIVDLFDSETPETSEDYVVRNGESPDSGTVSEDAVDCSTLIRLQPDTAVLPPSCSNTSTHWNPEDDKLLAELRILQDGLIGQCLCRFDEKLLNGLFNRRLNVASLPIPCMLTFLSTMQLMFDIYLKQNNTGTICSRLMQECDVLVTNRHDWITEVIELGDHKNKYVNFVACRVLASFLIVAKDTVDENWLRQIAENIYLFDRINRITVQKINFSLDVIKRIVEWKDVEQHPLEDSNYINSSNSVQEDNPFRSRVGYGTHSGQTPSSSHTDGLHNAFSNLQTHALPSTSSENSERPSTFRLQEPVLKFPVDQKFVKHLENQFLMSQ
ncbi:Protein lines [Eumeta japonica]|uniref:Protein lines n=1 Tax=Eumeta variegata TaxID=151549 RepID=A0A4C1ZQF4_EUMVA|nr:Protein lines [Eumeta japonica]